MIEDGIMDQGEGIQKNRDRCLAGCFANLRIWFIRLATFQIKILKMSRKRLYHLLIAYQSGEPLTTKFQKTILSI